MSDPSGKICTRCGFTSEKPLTVCPRDGATLQNLARDPLIGQNLDEKFYIIERLGSGGMSVVYRARHEYTGREVALKMMRPDHLEDGLSKQRFQKESQAVSTLKHPNIVTVYDSGLLSDGTLFISMDFLEGRTLDDLIDKEHPLSIERVLRIFSGILQGMEHAHSKAVVHRDLKPANVLITCNHDGEEIPVIVDFGIARVLADERSGKRLTATGQVFGSPLYMSPEQCRGESVDTRSDIYALGCILYQMLVGRPPLTGKNPMELMMKHIKKEPECPAKLREGVTISDELSECVMRCLRKNPDQRFQSVTDLRTSILACPEIGSQFPKADTDPDSASSTAATISPAKVSATLREIDEASVPADKTHSSESSVVATGVGLIVLLFIGGAIAYFLLSGGGDSQKNKIEAGVISGELENSDNSDDSRERTRTIQMGTESLPDLTSLDSKNITNSDSKDTPLPVANSSSSRERKSESGTDSRPTGQNSGNSLTSNIAPSSPSSGFSNSSPMNSSTLASVRQAVPQPISTSRSAGFPSSSSSSNVLMSPCSPPPFRTEFDGWKVETSLGGLSSRQPGEGSGEGTIFEVGMSNPSHTLLESEVREAFESISGGQIIVEPLQTVYGGPDGSLVMMLQKIAYPKRDPFMRTSRWSGFLVYYKVGKSIRVLQVVPKVSTNSAQEFIQRKLLPSFLSTSHRARP